MLITTMNQAGILRMRELLGLNNRLISVQYDKNIDLLTFEFCNSTAENLAAQEIDCFEMSRHYCDYQAFEIFACHCFDQFDPEKLTDAEIIAKSHILYDASLKLLKKPGKFNQLLNDHQKLYGNPKTIIKTDKRSTNFYFAAQPL